MAEKKKKTIEYKASRQNGMKVLGSGMAAKAGKEVEKNKKKKKSRLDKIMSQM